MEDVSTASESGARSSDLISWDAGDNALERLNDRKEGKDEEDQSTPVDELGAGLVDDCFVSLSMGPG